MRGFASKSLFIPKSALKVSRLISPLFPSRRILYLAVRWGTLSAPFNSVSSAVTLILA